MTLDELKHEIVRLGRRYRRNNMANQLQDYQEVAGPGVIEELRVLADRVARPEHATHQFHAGGRRRGGNSDAPGAPAARVGGRTRAGT